jgi:hypothetical protein
MDYEHMAGRCVYGFSVQSKRDYWRSGDLAVHLLDGESGSERRSEGNEERVREDAKARIHLNRDGLWEVRIIGGGRTGVFGTYVIWAIAVHHALQEVTDMRRASNGR